MKILNRYTQELILEITDLQYADLQGANLQGTDLRVVDLKCANLQGANLQDITMNWSSHNLIAHLLLWWAQQDPNKRMLAGLILISTDWCWKSFITISHPSKDEAVTYLKTLIKPDDNHPTYLD